MLHLNAPWSGVVLDLLRLSGSCARVPPCEQIFWESGVRLQLSGCEWREYSTSRGRPPCQTASWTERPSCGGRWGKKKRQASLKKLKQQGNKSGWRRVGVGPHTVTRNKQNRSRTAASVTRRWCQRWCQRQRSVDRNLTVVHTKCIF